MTKKLSALLACLFCTFFLYAQTVTDEEMKLYNLIMAYRTENNLPAVPISKSLSFVAQTHVKDLRENKPGVGNCNLHSWSSKGAWKACCYTAGHAQAECMWSKPRELTTYQGDGYEIACSSGDLVSAASALQIWQNSTAHRDVIINQDIWKNHPWNAIGIGISGGFAVVWFGTETDK